jgi:chromosomal replication initiator protein
LTSNDQEVVFELGEAIARQIGEPRYNLWFAEKTKLTWRDERLVVGVPNHFVQEWLEKKFGDDVATAAHSVVGRPVEISFSIDPQLFQAARRDQNHFAGVAEPTTPEAPTAAFAPAPAPSTAAPARIHSSRRERRWRQLSDFCVGSCNRVAHAAAVAMVEAPQQAASPLVIYGSVGTGKTHLLEGICHGLGRHRPEWQVSYVTAEEFTNRFVQAMRTSKLGAFRKSFRECDVLLVDDLQFLATKRATQEELLHTFDSLHTHGKCMVFTCDCHPRLADEFSPELADRLRGGAAWALEPPDLTTRRDILRSRSIRLGTTIPDVVLAELAELLRGNVRELEGVLHAIVHFSRVWNRPIDLQLMREALADHLRHTARLVRLEDVDRAVCQALCLEPGTLKSKQRNWATSHPRMVAMYLCRKHTSAAYSAIGNYFGGLNHSSVVAAEKKVRRWLNENASISLSDRSLPVCDMIDRIARHLNR